MPGRLRRLVSKKRKMRYTFHITQSQRRKVMPTSSHPSIAKMQQEVRTLLPRMTRAQARVVGEMVYAMLMIDGCGMTRMCSFLSELLGKPMNTLRHKYREIYYEKEAKAGVKKRGRKRREIVVEEHFADLLAGMRHPVARAENPGAGFGWQHPLGSI